MKVREIIRILRQDGWLFKTTKGGHRQFVHQVKKGRVTVPGNPNGDLSLGTLNSIMKQAGIKPREP